ncbi:hypothetical protein NDU88_000787, partial [Pleurodeles waltl]
GPVFQVIVFSSRPLCRSRWEHKVDADSRGGSVWSVRLFKHCCTLRCRASTFHHMTRRWAFGPSLKTGSVSSARSTLHLSITARLCC